MADENSKKKLNIGSFDATITLINPNETLVKKEEKSVVVRNLAGKLVRRTSKTGALPEIYSLINTGEKFVREEESRIVIRTEAGKLVARKKPETEIKKEADKEPVPVQPQEPAEEKKDLKTRLMERHAFLGRMERGEKIGVQQEQPSRPMQAVNTDLVEEIEDSNEDIEEIAPDAEVTQLENAVTQEKQERDLGKSSNKGVRANETVRYVSGGAKNPNEKPSLKGSATGAGLVGNVSLPEPEKLATPEPKKLKKAKKKRKPVKPWVIVLSLVTMYVIGMGIYFFTGYNFDKKQVNIVLYYIDVGSGAKLEYYDGEKFNSNEMSMTYYYDDEHIESFNITEKHFADTTVGMGYGLNKGHINALWVDSFKNASSRTVKVKFAFDNLVCYVPVTIYRNQLKSLEKTFIIDKLQAEQELYPTIFGIYSNRVLDAREEEIRQEIKLDLYDLILNYNGESYSLKENNCFDGTKYIMPTTIGEQTIDYSSGVSLLARVDSDGYNPTRTISLFSN